MTIVELVRKLTAVRTRPDQTIEHAKQGANKLLRLLHRGRLGAAGSFLVAGAIDRSPYDPYLRYQSWRHGGERTIPVRGHRMTVSMDDRGMSRDLLLYGVREERTAARFERELATVSQSVSEPITVLDIGANIGYYTLIEAQQLGPDDTVVAFEPDPQNSALLERNVSLNEYDDRVTIEQAAIGTESGTGTLQQSTHSNLHRLETSSTTTDHRDTGESIPVDVHAVDDYLAATGIDPATVRAIRMDLEGFEAELIPSMESVLAADGPLVMLVEMHPNILDDEETDRLLDTFQEYGFAVVDAIFEEVTANPFVAPEQVDSIDELRSFERGYNLVLKKGRTDG